MILETLVTMVIGFIILTFLLLRKPTPIWKEDGRCGVGSRRLGFFEAMLARMGKRAEGNICSIIFICSKSPLTEALIHSALNALSRKHPLLRMKLEKENGKFTYMREMTDFRVDLEVCQTDDWQKLMQDEALKIYDVEKGPLWKVRFIPETSHDDGEDKGIYPHQAACIFGFHHMITDGPSFLKLLGEFVEKLHEIIDRPNDEHPVESLPLLPPVDAYVDAANIYSPMYNLKTNIIHALGILTYFPSILTFILKATTKPALYVKNLGVEIDRNPNAGREMCILPVELTQEQTSQLLAACKRHKTTVQCVIQAAACLAYSVVANKGKVNSTNDVKCRLSVNLRRFLASPELDDSLGMYMSIFVMNTKVSPALSLWDIAKNISSDLQGIIKSHVPFLFFSLMMIIANLSEDTNPVSAANADLPGQRDMDLDFHNYGNFNFLNTDVVKHCKISGFFVGGRAVESGAVFGHVLATVNGKLSWTFDYFSHICNKEQAQEFADMTIKTLLEAIKG